MFQKVNDDNLDEACELLANSTPAIIACILNRDGISEKYVVMGLKALSKLTKQRNIMVKLDFNALEHLSPKGRLEAMRHLMGIINKWGSRPKELPFKTMPTKYDIERILFPCSMKYNEEVTNLLKRFDEISNPI